jgi:hypothetical protein
MHDGMRVVSMRNKGLAVVAGGPAPAWEKSSIGGNCCPARREIKVQASLKSINKQIKSII